MDKLLPAYNKIGGTVSLKIHYLPIFLFGFFPNNLGAVSDEPGKRFHPVGKLVPGNMGCEQVGAYC